MCARAGGQPPRCRPALLEQGQYLVAYKVAAVMRIPITGILYPVEGMALRIVQQLGTRKPEQWP